MVKETGTISRHRLGGAGGGSESPITGDMHVKEGGGLQEGLSSQIMQLCQCVICVDFGQGKFEQN